MFGIFSGTIVNALLVIVGTAAGLIFKTDRLQSIGERIFQVFALFVLAMGVNGASDLSRPVFILLSVTGGVALGEIIDLDDKFNRLGRSLQKRFARSDDSHFATGFIQASLLFCVGSMTVVGALQSGMDGNHSVLYAKSLIDGVSAATLAMGFGIGVGFSAISVLIYEGLLTLAAGAIAPVMSAEIIALSSTIGSLFLIGMALNMLKLTELKIANFLPAMFIPIFYEAVRLLLS
ncbi:MAG: DUF554 domain-containing protein [Eubacteriales bacterium]|jgi:hypothetical protein|nr:DUF554 domain-containing protein [Eubacteriales bacterium]